MWLSGVWARVAYLQPVIEGQGLVPENQNLLPEQEGLFSAPELAPVDPDVGYRGQVACNAAAITYRQLDYWARTGLVVPTIRPASGSGSQRLYSFRDIIVLKVVKRLLDTGVSLHNIRIAINHLRARGDSDLARITLLSDGASVYECTSDDEVIDLVRNGQGVFGIAVGKVWEEIESTLAIFPAEKADGSLIAPPGLRDELAEKRRTKTS